MLTWDDYNRKKALQSRPQAPSLLLWPRAAAAQRVVETPSHLPLPRLLRNPAGPRPCKPLKR